MNTNWDYTDMQIRKYAHGARFVVFCFKFVPISFQGRFTGAGTIKTLTWAPSQYKDRLISVWRFPC